MTSKRDSAAGAIGFDLDMTLIDSRPGIAATYRALTAQTGVYVDADLAVARLGPPLRTELGHWFAAGQLEAAVNAYRALYPQHAVAASVALPGAARALAAVRRRGLRVVVVTSKLDRLAQLHLDHLGIVADAVVGDVFAEGKAPALIEHGVRCYVGDHVGDMLAATTAGVPGIAVTTGPCNAEELSAAGAVQVLADLTGLPDVLARIAIGSDGSG